MADVWIADVPPEAAKLLEEVRSSIAKGKPMGVTMQGRFLTVRWGSPKMKYATFVLTDLNDGEPEEEPEDK